MKILVACEESQTATKAFRSFGHEASVCLITLYSYIDKKVFLHLTNKNLWEKSKRKKRSYETVKRIAHPLLPCITQRPDWINIREEPGHYEMDLIVSCEDGTGCLLTMTERAGRHEIIRKIPDRRAETVRTALQEIKRQVPNIKSITTDNGPEFLEYSTFFSASKTICSRLTNSS